MTDEKEVDLKAELLKQFKKQYPDSPLEELDKSDLATIPGWVTTGNYALNWITSKNMFKGLPLGRVCLFTGDPGSGKSMISLSMMREKSIDLVIYMDSEGGGITKEFAEFLGIDISKVLYQQIDTVEELIDKMRFTIDNIEKNKTKKNILMVIDSISMVSTDREKDESGGADMGNKAKQTRQFFRQYIRKMQKLNICCVMTGHLTQNIGSYGGGKSVSGGTILGYAPSIEIRFAKINKESETEMNAKGTKLVKIRASIEKSRFGTHGKRVMFDLDMQSGLDPYAGIADILKDYNYLIVAKKDVEQQIKDKDIPKKSSGYWIFNPYIDATKSIVEKLIEAGEYKEFSKFRESNIKKWAENYTWFLPEVQLILDSIYYEPDLEEELSDEEKNLLENTNEIVEQIQEINDTIKTTIEKVEVEKKEPKPRKKNVEITEA